MTSGSMKFRLVVLIILMLVIVSSGILLINMGIFNKFVDTSTYSRLDKLLPAFADDINSLKQQSLGTGNLIALNSDLVSMIESGDKNGVGALLKALTANSNADFSVVTDMKGNILASTGKQDKAGENIADRNDIQLAIGGAKISLIENISGLGLSIVSGVPVKNGAGTIVGIVSTGFVMQKDTFVDQIKSKFDVDISIFQNDLEAASTIVANGTRVSGLKLDTDVAGKVLNEGLEYKAGVNIEGIRFLSVYKPILGIDNKPIGAVFLGEPMTEENAAKSNFITSGLVALFLFVIAFSVVAFLFILMQVSKPLKQAETILKRIAGADLSTGLGGVKAGNSEIGSMFKLIEEMRISLKGIIQGVVSEARNINDAANNEESGMKILNAGIEEISSTSQQLSAGMEETAASTQELNSITVEMETEIASIAEKAVKVTASADEISQRANELKGTVLNARENAGAVYAMANEKMRAAIDQAKAAEQITGLANVILAIASQTNLLALNASIEAARAGESGRGFTVVASEIGKLAESSRQTVSEIQKVISGFVESVGNLTESSKEVLDFIDNQVIKDYDAFVVTGEQYSADAALINGLAGEFTYAARQLSCLAGNITKAVGEIAVSNNEGAEGTESIASRSVDMLENSNRVLEYSISTRKSAEALDSLVQKFK